MEHAHVDVLANELGWTLERILDALEGLEQQLQVVGQVLAWAGDSLVAAAHRTDDATNAIAERLVAGNLAETELSIVDARLLYAACTQHERTSRANALPVLNLRKLEMAGLLTTEPEGTWERGSGIHITELAKRNLALEPTLAPSCPQLNPEVDRRRRAWVRNEPTVHGAGCLRSWPQNRDRVTRRSDGR